jgi:hypothetical protein
MHGGVSVKSIGAVAPQSLVIVVPYTMIDSTITSSSDMLLCPARCRNVGCVLAVLPAHLQFGRYMWSRARASATAQLVALPAAILALVVTDLQTLRVAAVLGLAMCGGQFLSMRHVQHVGQKLI